MAEVERAFIPTAHLMSMYHNAHGKNTRPSDHMPDFSRRKRGPGIEAYNSFARAAGINAKS